MIDPNTIANAIAQAAHEAAWAYVWREPILNIIEMLCAIVGIPLIILGIGAVFWIFGKVSSKRPAPSVKGEPRP